MRTLVIAVAGVALLAATGCSQAEIAPSEQAMLQQWASDGADFESIRQAVTMEPKIRRIEWGEDGVLSVQPASASRERVGTIGSLMQRLGIVSVSASPPDVDILMFEHAGRDRYDSRMFTYRPLDPSPETVASIDQQIQSDLNSDHTVFRSLGEGWYIRATSIPSATRQ